MDLLNWKQYESWQCSSGELAYIHSLDLGDSGVAWVHHGLSENTTTADLNFPLDDETCSGYCSNDLADDNRLDTPRIDPPASQNSPDGNNLTKINLSEILEEELVRVRRLNHRREQNRISQRKFRQRREIEHKKLVGEVRVWEDKYKQLSKTCNELYDLVDVTQAHVKRSKEENDALRKALVTMTWREGSI